jgi:AraC family transcriptional regulator of arabinose operon
MLARAPTAAAALNISLSRLRHLFKQQTGISFCRFVKNVNLDYAKTLLVSSRLSVKEITVKCGFNDVSHFVRDFKAAYGKTPMKFRISEIKSKRAAIFANT